MRWANFVDAPQHENDVTASSTARLSDGQAGIKPPLVRYCT